MCSSGARRARSRSSSTSTGRRARAARRAKSCCRSLATTTAGCWRRASWCSSSMSMAAVSTSLITTIGFRSAAATIRACCSWRWSGSVARRPISPAWSRASPASPPAAPPRRGGRSAGARRPPSSRTWPWSPRPIRRPGRRSRPPSRRSTALPASPRAFARSIACSTIRSTASPSGASPAPTSTTAASSTSTSWPGSGWSAPRCSSRPTAWSCA